MTHRVGAVDCGTNSIRLLIAEGDAAGLREIHREMRIVRLGQGVDATGQLAPEALERTRAALADYTALMGKHQVDRVRMVATSAIRDAGNRGDFFAMARAELGSVVAGAEAEVVTGEQEAQLSFFGAVGELPSEAGPFVVVDLGGGSTELVAGDSSRVWGAFSADIGCVRITERCLPGNPPEAEHIAAARDVITARLDEALARVPVDEARTWIGVAGTMTTLAGIALDLPEYDPIRIHGARIPVNQVHSVCERLIHSTHDQRAALGVMHPGRVDVIGGGALITQVLAEKLAHRAGITELMVSEHDILDGIAQSLI